MFILFDFSFILFILLMTFSIVLVFIIFSMSHFVLILIFLDLLLLLNILILSCLTLGLHNIIGYQYTLLVFGIAAADTAVGLGLFVLYFKITGSSKL